MSFAAPTNGTGFVNSFSLTFFGMTPTLDATSWAMGRIAVVTLSAGTRLVRCRLAWKRRTERTAADPTHFTWKSVVGATVWQER